MERLPSWSWGSMTPVWATLGLPRFPACGGAGVSCDLSPRPGTCASRCQCGYVEVGVVKKCRAT